MDAVDLLVSKLCEEMSELRAVVEAPMKDFAASHQISRGGQCCSADAPTPTRAKPEFAEIQSRLSLAQNDLAEMALRFGAAQGEIASLRTKLAITIVDRDAWQAQAQRLSVPFFPRAWSLRRAN
ncbi:hypothetical protein [Methylobacterium planeticum]|uniref:Uncharacterized protein n=1 Tax=Methylobacterium planeticum TaxID=2615211 RepID=A0A6N6MJ96_9HYPH|nr:hypothetical protein [Methylobacterium planeticum]KAB1070113.1 hypothetical protein F6X51_23845 [Methylobacterium planeticum]